jgi:hypothetical protein
VIARAKKKRKRKSAKKRHCGKSKLGGGRPVSTPCVPCSVFRVRVRCSCACSCSCPVVFWLLPSFRLFVCLCFA